jgi:hypothetical protein
MLRYGAVVGDCKLIKLDPLGGTIGCDAAGAGVSLFSVRREIRSGDIVT